jgi:arsenate reductase
VTKTRVLFACTHNSARSQMAEALLNGLGADAFEAHSAGTEAIGIRPETLAVMAELGYDLAGHWSKTISEFSGQSFDWFITVCDDAQESCPVLPGVPNNGHWSIDDPSATHREGDERLNAFRRARDEIDERVRQFVQDAAPTA